jgi:death-on-curing protein
VTDPRWISLTIVLAIHSDQGREHGGGLGLRDRGLLESALARPLNRVTYEPDSDLFDLAASYGFGIARNHPFVDGNKRVAFQVMYVFLGVNDFTITASETEVVDVILELAGGSMQEAALATWLREHTKAR